MILRNKGTCKDCGRKEIYLNSKGLCEDCVYKQNHDGMSRVEVAKMKSKSKSNKVYQLKRTPLKSSKSELKRSRIKSRPETIKKRKEILKKDRELYFKVFSSRPRYCEECGVELPDRFEDDDGNIIMIEQYSHRVSKGANPFLRHKVENIDLLCGRCHDRWEFGDRENMKIFNKYM
jgi:hypothetical protein